MNDTTAAPTEVKAVYLGTCELENGKRGNLWLPVEILEANRDSDKIDLRLRASAYAAKRSGFTVGGIYRAAGTMEDGRIKTFTQAAASFAGRADFPALPELEADAKADALLAAGKAAERKLREEPRLMKEMEGLRALYRKTGLGPRRLALEFAILNMLRTRD